ncbi:MAG: prepilin peptidase [Clostridia bacterium]|nr:prepilin peptidase [Clostridia bacterium]
MTMVNTIAVILCAAALIYGGVVDYTRREIPDFVHIILLFSRILIGFSVLYGIMCLVIPAVLLIAAAKISKSRLAGGDFKLLCGLCFACGLPELTAILFLAFAGAMVCGRITQKPINRGIPLCTYIAPAYIAVKALTLLAA